MMLRVGIVLPYLNFAGPEQWLLTLLRNADPLRLTFSGVAVCPWFGSWTPSVLNEVARFCPVRTTNNCTWEAAISDLVRQSDVVICWGTQRGHLPRLFGDFVRDGGRVVYLAHGNAPADGVRGHEAGATHYVAVSRQAIDFFLPENRKAVTVVHNGVDVERVKPRRHRDEVLRELGLGGPGRVVGFVGALTPRKNPVLLARAVSAAKASDGPEAWRLLCVGGGHLAADVKAACPDVVFAGWVRHVGDYLQCMDILVSTAREEPFGLAIAEALQSAVRVVTTGSGVTSDLGGLFPDQRLYLPEVSRDCTPTELATAVRIHLSRGAMPEGSDARRYLTGTAMAVRWEDYLTSIFR